MYFHTLVDFVLLVVAAEILVREAVPSVDRFGISPLVTGMTVIAIGTSVKELVVSVCAILGGSSGLAIGLWVSVLLLMVFISFLFESYWRDINDPEAIKGSWGFQGEKTSLFTSSYGDFD